LLFLLNASAVFAVDMEYYTYNGFDAVFTAWSQTAMVFSNNDYGMLFFSVIVAAMLFGGVATYYKMFQGANISPLAWMLPIGFGVVIYLGLFVPKATFHVYDPVQNRYQPVSGVPQGIVILAGVTNLVERGIVEIIETSGAPLSYKQYAGGIGFDSLLKTTADVSLNDKYVEASTSRFITDCLYFELNRPGTSLLISDIMNNTGSLLTLFGEAANPSVFTVWYDSGNPSGSAVSCYDAYNSLNSYFGDSTKMNDMVRSKCSGAGFDPDNNDELLQCKEILEQTVQYTTGNSVSTEKFFQQVVLAQHLATAASSGGIDETITMKGNINTMSSAYGAGIQANEWIPLIRAIVTAVAIGLMPVLVIFIPTGIGNKAIAMISGFFIWLTFWGVVDVIIHKISMNYSYKYFEMTRQNNIGFASIMAMPDAAAKSLALFGLVRSVGMGLATAITLKIASFVDAHSLSMVGGQLSGTVQSQGAGAGQVAKIEGTAEAIKGPVAAEATMANAHKYGIGGMTEAAAADQMTHTGSSLGAVDSLGGGNLSHAVDRMAGANVTERAESVGRAEGKGGPERSGVMGYQQGQQSWGAALQDMRMAEALGGISQQQLGEFRQHGVITDKMAASIGRTLGLSGEQSRQELSGMQVNPHALSVNQDTGGLMLTHGELQSADGSKILGHGMITRSSMMTGQQILDKADQFMKLGHTEAAEGLMKMVSPNVSSSDGRIHGMAEQGRGLLANEAAKFTEQTSYDNKFGTMSMEHGSAVQWYDTSSDKQGRTIDHGDHVRVGDSVDKGNHTTLGNTITLNDGTSIPAQSAAQMAMGGDELLVSQISRKGLTDKERDAQRLAVAAAVADGMGSLIKRTGTSQDYSRADGSVGGNIPGTKIGGSVATGYNTTDTYDSSLMAHHYNEVLKSAFSDAASKGLNKKDMDAMAAERLQIAVQEEIENFEKHGKWSYGATGGVTRIGEAIAGNDSEADVD
jgi:hypothetical protein